MEGVLEKSTLVGLLNALSARTNVMFVSSEALPTTALVVTSSIVEVTVIALELVTVSLLEQETNANAMQASILIFFILFLLIAE